MINAILIMLAVAVYMLAIFQFARYLGHLIHFCMNDEKEGTTHDNDA